jgi:hypothetical protein
VCLPNGECCTADQCPTAECGIPTCVTGQCGIFPAPQSTRCSNGVCCNDQCVDTTSNVDHCGACGDECGPHATCNNGACRCDAGFINCGIGCHAGVCCWYGDCPSGYLCHASECVCGPGRIECAGSCVDGTCCDDADCLDNQACTANQCV